MDFLSCATSCPVCSEYGSTIVWNAKNYNKSTENASWRDIYSPGRDPLCSFSLVRTGCMSYVLYFLTVCEFGSGHSFPQVLLVKPWTGPLP